MSRRIVVTGAFSYIGAAVARELLRRGHAVHTLTNRTAPPAVSDDRITTAPLRFGSDALVAELSGADALVNTYWIRLPHAGQTFATAVRNSRTLHAAAKRAGVRRVVHVSVSNARSGRNLGYFAGKADVEECVRQTHASFAIVRPTLVVGPADVLTNNIAWFLRRFPFFPMPDGGQYRLQPITLSDTGRIVCDALESPDSQEIDAAGPQIITFAELVRLIARACGVRRWFPAAPGWLALAGIRLVEPILRDVVLTHEELLGLEQELLLSHAPPLGRESVEDVLLAQGETIGRRYANDLYRHFGDGRRTAVTDPRGK